MRRCQNTQMSMFPKKPALFPKIHWFWRRQSSLMYDNVHFLSYCYILKKLFGKQPSSWRRAMIGALAAESLRWSWWFGQHAPHWCYKISVCFQAETENEWAQIKTIMFAIAMAGVEPGCMIYDKLMRGFILRKFKVEIPDIKEEFSSKCWGCGRDSKEINQDKEPEKSLKTCSRCGVAR